MSLYDLNTAYGYLLPVALGCNRMMEKIKRFVVGERDEIREAAETS